MLAGLPGCDQEKWRWTLWSLKSTSIMKTRCRWRQVTWNRKAVNPPDSWSTKCTIPFLAQVADILHTSYHIISKIEIYWSFAALLLNTYVFMALYAQAFVFVLLCVCMKQRDLYNSDIVLSLWIRCLCVSSGSEEYYSQRIWHERNSPYILWETYTDYLSYSEKQSYMFCVMCKIQLCHPCALFMFTGFNRWRCLGFSVQL